MAMTFGYISNDEVNRWWVAKEADNPDDFTVKTVHSEDDLPNSALDAIVYDLDHIPDDLKRVLDELSKHPPARPTAVHGYNIDDEVAEALSINGVHVHRQVDSELFAQLSQVLTADKRKAA